MNKPSVTERTFRERVISFWEWYASASPRLLAGIESRNFDGLTEEVSQRVKSLGPHFGWVFGPGDNGSKHSFTLSGEGVISHHLLASYWRQMAPSLPEWSFHSARQPSDEPGKWRLKIHGEEFDPLGCWATPFVDEQDEVFDITIWHPLLMKLPEKEHLRVLFLILDEVFGELGTARWIGEIKVSPSKLAAAMPVAELGDFVKTESERRGWRLYPPGECFSGFQFNGDADFPRGDTLTWVTKMPSMVRDWMESEGSPEDPFAGTGASLVYLRMDRAFLPVGQEVDARSALEDLIEHFLMQEQSGIFIGGAMGTDAAYSDLLLFDAARSLGIIDKVLRERKLPPGTGVFPFAGKPQKPLLSY